MRSIYLGLEGLPQSDACIFYFYRSYHKKYEKDNKYIIYNILSVKYINIQYA